jgi:hypothetical protein
MTILSLVELPMKEWTEVLAKWGDGKVYAEFGQGLDYRTECTVEAFPGHHVIHGKNTETNDLTNSGFLRNQTGQVVRGVFGLT